MRRYDYNDYDYDDYDEYGNEKLTNSELIVWLFSEVCAALLVGAFLLRSTTLDIFNYPLLFVGVLLAFVIGGGLVSLVFMTVGNFVNISHKHDNRKEQRRLLFVKTPIILVVIFVAVLLLFPSSGS